MTPPFEASHERPAAPPPRLRAACGFGFVAALSALAGMTDAIGFLAAGDFVSFMSGNTTRLAIAIGTGAMADIARLTAIVAIFVLGNMLGVVVVRRTGDRIWPLLLLVAALLLSSAVSFGADTPILSLLPTVLAMGLLNAAVESVAGHPISLTYVTGALSRFGKGLGRRLCGDRGNGYTVQIIPWIGMFAGAIAGTMLQLSASRTALLVAAGLALLLALIAFVMPRSWALAYLGRAP